MTPSFETMLSSWQRMEPSLTVNDMLPVTPQHPADQLPWQQAVNLLGRQVFCADFEPHQANHSNRQIFASLFPPSLWAALSGAITHH